MTIMGAIIIILPFTYIKPNTSFIKHIKIIKQQYHNTMLKIHENITKVILQLFTWNLFKYGFARYKLRLINAKCNYMTIYKG